LLVLLAFAATSGSPMDTAAVDLRHRWIALTARATDADLNQPPAVPPPSSMVGMNVFLEQEVEPEKRQVSLELLRAAGVGWIRQELPWEQIEPVARGEYVDPKFDVSTWDKFDDIVDRANALGFTVVLRLDTTPEWARPPDATDGRTPPVRYEDYWDFVEAAANHFRGRVRAYQIWNEPNLDIEWGGQPPDPVSYARLLRGAAERVRRADPQAQVVMAALSPTLTDNQDAQNELLYLQGLYEAGAKGAFDVLALQAYGLRGGPDDPRTDVTDVTFSRPRLVRDVMLQNGDRATPVWATEVGWNVNPPDLAEQKFGRVTPTLQARYTVRAFDRARQEWPWLQVLYVWFWKRADEANREQDWFWFRLADPDFSLQPVYFALRDYVQQRGL
jgi:hypothetical protein